MSVQTSPFYSEEKQAPYMSGMFALLASIALFAAAIAGIVFSIMRLGQEGGMPLGLFIAAVAYLLIVLPISCAGFKVLKPNEAYVFTLFGRYYGSIARAGFYFVNPFVSAVAPAQAEREAKAKKQALAAKAGTQDVSIVLTKKKVSLKVTTLNNSEQKINDALGNPIIIGIVVIWRVVNPTKALLNVDDYAEYLSIQCDSALRNIVRLYPYDSDDERAETSLRGSSQEIADKLRVEIQGKMELAGIEISEARITKLSYAPEIAAAMLQKQQASAIIAARQMIVEGAVGMVEMALAKLNENKVVSLDEERKAAMVSNLLVVLCGNKDAQPVVNSGSLY